MCRTAVSESLRLLATVLREARDTDVWRFTTVDEVVALWPVLERHLGRRRRFWEFLLGKWKESVSPLLDTGMQVLREVADELSASCEATQTAPDSRRVIVSRETESLVVDLVFDRAPQARPDKLWFGHVRVDPAEEVFANKLCALLGRAEIRDLVDVRALERAGLSLREALQAGSLKDGGLTPGQLAWVLSEVTIGPDAAVPGGVTAADLSAYLDDLIARLAVLARP